MKPNRREFLTTTVSAAASLAAGVSTGASQKPSQNPKFSGKHLGSIFNSDSDNILWASSGKDITVEEYQRGVYAMLDLKPGLLAYEVGHPDPVTYRTSVATTYDKYQQEVITKVWKMLKQWKDEYADEMVVRVSGALKKLFQLGTDPLTLTIEACRNRGVPIVASYRMNAEDFYQFTLENSDFARAHPDWKIPEANCLDPAVPQVYDHRMKIFTEVAERYDIDGIEFDFRRWYHMVSDPLKNYPVLTRMVRDTRKMLDETARKKGRKKLILGARVGPSLATDPGLFVYPGDHYGQNPVNGSCKELGLDVKTWIAEKLVDYLCPSLWGNSGLPKSREFAALARGTGTGIYPTLFTLAGWQYGICDEKSQRTITLEPKDQRALAVYKDDLCTTALRMYEEGADGISTFNWFSHLFNAKMPRAGVQDEPGAEGSGGQAVQTYIYPLLKDPAAIRRYREEPWAVPPKA